MHPFVIERHAARSEKLINCIIEYKTEDNAKEIHISDGKNEEKESLTYHRINNKTLPIN